MKNYQRIFGPAQSFSSYGDLVAPKFLAGLVLLIILPAIFWLMWQSANKTSDFPKVWCQGDTCTFTFKDGSQRRLPRSSVPFDKDGLVIKDKIIWP
jgi:hypothetical protein